MLPNPTYTILFQHLTHGVVIVHLSPCWTVNYIKPWDSPISCIIFKVQGYIAVFCGLSMYSHILKTGERRERGKMERYKDIFAAAEKIWKYSRVKAIFLFLLASRIVERWDIPQQTCSIYSTDSQVLRINAQLVTMEICFLVSSVLEGSHNGSSDSFLISAF